MTLAEKISLEPKVLIDNVEYLSTAQVASLLGFSVKTINQLIKKGNKYDQMKACRRKGFTQWGYRNLVPVKELFRFTFCEVGPYGRPFRFTEEGLRQYTFELERRA